MTKFNAAFETDDKRFSVVGGTPSRLKKITATRFSKVIGCNHWSNDFQAWCEIMKVAEPPFEDNKYTIAGKAIEPKLVDYCRNVVSPYIQMPDDYFGKAKGLRWDFFPENKIFGGMWDALAFARPDVTSSDSDKPIAIIEAKTSSRPQDWENGVPENYKAQGLLYAYLLGVDDIYFPVAFLKPEDYDNPESFECTDENTRVFHIKADSPVGDFYRIEDAIAYALDWHEKHIDKNLSPCYNDKADAEYLAILRSCGLADLKIDTNDLEALCQSLLELDNMIEAKRVECGLKELEEQRKTVNKAIQSIVKPILMETDGKDSLDTQYYTFKVSTTRKVDCNALEEDGLLDKYVTNTSTIRTSKK